MGNIFWYVRDSVWVSRAVWPRETDSVMLVTSTHIKPNALKQKSAWLTHHHRGVTGHALAWPIYHAPLSNVCIGVYFSDERFNYMLAIPNIKLFALFWHSDAGSTGYIPCLPKLVSSQSTLTISYFSKSCDHAPYTSHLEQILRARNITISQ